jgi:hypothetical protein
MSDAEGPDAETGHDDADGERPAWDDAYLDEVAGRLAYNYDLERDYRVRGERFGLYGRMELHSEKHFLHPSIAIAHHESYEHLFVRRTDAVSTADVDRLVDLGHGIADEWIEPHEEHYSTEFTFGLVAPAIPENVRSKVTSLDERTLLKFGYNGHYEINVLVVAPEAHDVVANDAADVEEAFRTWDDIEQPVPGLLGLIARRLQL